MEIPPPPRDDDSFKAFYRHKRSMTIAVATGQGGGRLPDPEQTALTAWAKFYPYWARCEHPLTVLHKCVRSTVIDELRRLGRQPSTVLAGDFGEDSALKHLIRENAAQRSDPEPARLAPGRSWDSWRSWDPPLADALSRLSAKMREAVILDCELNPGERPVSETAQMLGLREPAARGRLTRAYNRLRQLLPDGYLDERKERLRDAGGLEERSAQ